MKGKFPRLKKILADGGYAGERLFNLAHSSLKAIFEVVTRREEAGSKLSLSVGSLKALSLGLTGTDG